MEALGQLISDIFSSAKESITKAFEKMGEWFDTNVVTPIKNAFSELALKAETTWNNIKDWATTTWDEIVSAVDKAIQDIQGFIDSLTGKDIKIGVTGGFVGKSANPNLSSASPTAYTPSAYTITPQFPYLATGAVIPPNAPFMAVLGDQRNGTNIEAPLATIKQALREEMDESGLDIDVNLNISGDLAGLVRYLYPAIEVERKRKGPSLAKASIG